MNQLLYDDHDLANHVYLGSERHTHLGQRRTYTSSFRLILRSMERWPHVSHMIREIRCILTCFPSVMSDQVNSSAYPGSPSPGPSEEQFKRTDDEAVSISLSSCCSLCVQLYCDPQKIFTTHPNEAGPATSAFVTETGITGPSLPASSVPRTEESLG